MQPASVGVLLEPRPQSRPLAQQRLVRDLDLALADRDQPRRGEDVEHLRDRVALELAQPGAAPHDGVALALSGQPQQDPPGQRPARGVELLVGLLGLPRDRPADAPGLLVVGQPQRAAVAALPQLQQRRRDQRQRTGLALDVGDQRVDQLALDPQAGPARRQLDRTAQLLAEHRADEHVAGAQEPRQLRVGGAATVVVGAHGDDHQRAPAHIAHGGHERVDERRAL